MPKSAILFFIITFLCADIATAEKSYVSQSSGVDSIAVLDSLSPLISFHPWTPLLVPKPHPSLVRLSENDFIQAARELGVEVATIKAVVHIEAGPTGKGFHDEGIPIINFDFTLFKKFSRQRGIKLSSYKKSHPIVFASLNIKKYGSVQQAQYARLNCAPDNDSGTALEATFWGMFQIGGFNWKRCGCLSVNDFVEKMSTSEHEQLELFVRYIISRNLERYLQAKNWAGFALQYNGKNYARHSYHTRLAKAYRKYATKRKK